MSSASRRASSSACNRCSSTLTAQLRIPGQQVKGPRIPCGLRHVHAHVTAGYHRAGLVNRVLPAAQRFAPAIRVVVAGSCTIESNVAWIDVDECECANRDRQCRRIRDQLEFARLPFLQKLFFRAGLVIENGELYIVDNEVSVLF